MVNEWIKETPESESLIGKKHFGAKNTKQMTFGSGRRCSIRYYRSHLKNFKITQITQITQK
jgi:hypothetical protein